MWMILLAVSISVAVGGRMVAAQVHHVVGGDRGWEPSTDLASWFAGRDFRVGDIICKESFLLFVPLTSELGNYISRLNINFIFLFFMIWTHI